MNISIIGMGYVGLVTGACLAEKGHRVICVDIDREKVDRVNQAVPPIYEKSLPDLLKKNVPQKLRATTDINAAVRDTGVTFIAVGTPLADNEIELGQVREAARQVGKALKGKDAYHVVVVKSTVVPGTTDEVVLPILEKASGKKAGADFGVGVNPEFLREGDAVEDFLQPDRIVLGGIDARSIAVLEEMYSVFPGVALLKTNCKTAEMIKYTANALLAAMISFSNEIANLCSAIGGVDVVEVMRGVHLDKRLTPIMANGERIIPAFTTYLAAGCGFGGSCFPKDLKALNSFAAGAGSPMHLLEAVMAINEAQPQQLLSLLKKHYPRLRGRRVTVLGLAFKPGTDDMRESPAIPVIKALLMEGAAVKAYDPVALENARKIFAERISYAADLTQAVTDVDAILLLTAWEEFKTLPQIMKQHPEPPLVIDGRRMLPRDSVPRYEGIGL